MVTTDPPGKKQRFRAKLSGIFPSITTPFIQGEVRLEHLESNIKKYNQLPLGGYMILGGNGEYLGLTEKETLQVVETIMESAKPGRTIVAGAGRESAEATISFIKSLSGWNIDIASIITPFYFAKSMNEASLTAYFTKIADESPIPILLYNSPDYAAGLEITPHMISVLSRHENIVGMKNSSQRNISEFIEALDDGVDFLFHTGKAKWAYQDLLSGAIGATLSMAIYWPEGCIELFERFRQGRLDDAAKSEQAIQRISHAGLSSYGVPGVKYLLDLRGYYGGDPRLPLLPLTQEQKTNIQSIYKTELMNSDEDSNRM